MYKNEIVIYTKVDPETERFNYLMNEREKYLNIYNDYIRLAVNVRGYVNYLHEEITVIIQEAKLKQLEDELLREKAETVETTETPKPKPRKVKRKKNEDGSK